MSKGGIASGFAFGYDPTGRSLFFLKQTEYFYSMFDVGRSMFDVQFFIQHRKPGPPSGL